MLELNWEIRYEDTAMEWSCRHYLHILHAVGAVLQWPALLQWWAHSRINSLFLFVQVTDNLIQTSHQLAALLLLLVWGDTQTHTTWWASSSGFIHLLQWHRVTALVGGGGCKTSPQWLPHMISNKIFNTLQVLFWAKLLTGFVHIIHSRIETL